MRIDLPDILKDKTVTIIGGGPSLEGFDFTRIKGYVIGVNNSAFFTSCDMVVSVDKQWQLSHPRFLKAYGGIFITDREAAVPATMIEYTAKAAGSLDWTMKTVNLSGFIALALALHLKAAKVILLGFDGGYCGQETNFYNNPDAESDYGYSRANDYYYIFKGNNIINGGMGSKIESFPKVPLEGNFYEP